MRPNSMLLLTVLSALMSNFLGMPINLSRSHDVSSISSSSKSEIIYFQSQQLGQTTKHALLVLFCYIKK